MKMSAQALDRLPIRPEWKRVGNDRRQRRGTGTEQHIGELLYALLSQLDQSQGGILYDAAVGVMAEPLQLAEIFRFGNAPQDPGIGRGYTRLGGRSGSKPARVDPVG